MIELLLATYIISVIVSFVYYKKQGALSWVTRGDFIFLVFICLFPILNTFMIMFFLIDFFLSVFVKWLNKPLFKDEKE